MTRIIDATTGRLIGHLDLPYGEHPADCVPALMWEMTDEEGWTVASVGFETIYVKKS